jgi:L-lysine exporter family protein LysE/ArgO
MNSFILALGVGFGAFFWFLSLISLINKFENKFTSVILQKINMACGLIIMVFGLYLGLSLFKNQMIF